MEIKYLNLEYFFYKFFYYLTHLSELLARLHLDYLISKWKIIVIFISIILVVGIIFLVFKISLLGKKKIKAYIDIFTEEGPLEDRSSRWREIKGHMDSDIPEQWKMAIIESDVLIDNIFKKTGYGGDTLGEKLKNIEPSDFDNLQNVWEAHKIRNRIVHDGNYPITKEEAKEVIGKYEKALKEFKYI